MAQAKLYKNKKYARLDEAQAEAKQQIANERERARTVTLAETYRQLNNLLCCSDNAAKRSQQEILTHAIEHITELRTALQTAQQPHSDTVQELYQYMGVQPSGSDNQHHVACRMPSLDPQPDVRQYGIDHQFNGGFSSCRYQPNVTHNGLLDYNMSAIQQNNLSGTNSAELSSCRYQPNVTHNGLLDYNMAAIQQNHLSGTNSAELSSCRFQTAGGVPKRRRLSPVQTWLTQPPHLCARSGGLTTTSPPTSPPTSSSTTSPMTSPMTSPPTSPPTSSSSSSTTSPLTSSPTSLPTTPSSSLTTSPTTSPTLLQIPPAAQFNQPPAPYTAMGIAMNNIGYSFIM